MARIKICKEDNCHDAATTNGYCRLHYLRRWKEIHEARKRGAARKLNRYIERVVRENPDDYAEVIRKDLENPDFDRFVEDAFGSEQEEIPFDEETAEEEIEQILRRLKVEEGF
ncbi:MAG: hypothetical protein WC956_03165 [bacterium]